MAFFFIKKNDPQAHIVDHNPEHAEKRFSHRGDVCIVVPNSHQNDTGFCPGDLKNFYIVSSAGMADCSCQYEQVCEACQQKVVPWIIDGDVYRRFKWRYDLTTKRFINKETERHVQADGIIVNRD